MCAGLWYSSILIDAQNLQARAISRQTVYSWHDVAIAGQIFPYDTVLRETAADIAIQMNLPKCMAVPVLQSAHDASPYDRKWIVMLDAFRHKPGPDIC